MDEQPKLQKANVDQNIQNQNDFVFPGEIVNNEGKLFNAGVYKRINDNALVALNFGLPTLAKSKNQQEVRSLMKFSVQYMPMKNDIVIGVVKVRASQHFVVEIGGHLDAIIGVLEFDGATKRNKPNLQVGSTIFCRVSEQSKYTGARLSCINKGFSVGSNISKSDQNSKSNDLGELKGGVMVYASLNRHPQIKKQIFEKVAKITKFEAAFGRNGRIWISSSSQNNLNIICNMIRLIEEKSLSIAISIISSMISLLK